MAYTESDVFVSVIQLFENIVQRKRLTERYFQINGGVVLLYSYPQCFETRRATRAVFYLINITATSQVTKEFNRCTGSDLLYP